MFVLQRREIILFHFAVSCMSSCMSVIYSRENLTPPGKN